MVHTVRLMVAREPEPSRRRASRFVLGAFLLGGASGGLLLGVAVALLARIVFLVAGESAVYVGAVAAGAIAVAYAGHAAGVFRLPRPQFPHQVPEAWRNAFSAGAASFVYSAALGVSVFTKIPSAALYPLIALTLGWGEAVPAILAIFGAAGLLRAATALLVPLRGWDRLPGDLVTQQITSAAPRIKRHEGSVLLLSGLLLVALSATSWVS